MDIRREILRNVILCQSLEPLGKKPGLTSRTEDSSPGAKLEYFIISSVNCSWNFYDLADRILTDGRQPDCIFEYAFEAQNASIRNRLGSKVNYGQIMLLTPLIAAQALEYLETGTFDDVEAILERTADVLRNTTEKDVEYLDRFIRLGYELSARHHERLGGKKPPRDWPLRGKYPTVWESLHDFMYHHLAREMAESYPNALRAYRFLLHNLEEGILPASDLIYRLLVTEINRPDFVADIIACGIYLVLTRHPEEVLFG